MALIKCSECGAEISDKAQSCIKCGCPVEAEKAEINEIGKKVFCRHCGTENHQKDSMCCSCGKMLQNGRLSFCPFCGFKIRDILSGICGNCDAKLITDSPKKKKKDTYVTWFVVILFLVSAVLIVILNEVGMFNGALQTKTAPQQTASQMTVPLWNIKDTNFETNGNIVTAFEELKKSTKADLIKSAVPVESQILKQAVWKYYGKIVKVSYNGNVPGLLLKTYPPGSDISNRLGGGEISEIAYNETGGGIDCLLLGDIGSYKIIGASRLGTPFNIYGYAVGYEGEQVVIISTLFQYIDTADTIAFLQGEKVWRYSGSAVEKK